MIERGDFDGLPDVELLEGYLVEKMTEGPLHAAFVFELLRWLIESMPKDVAVRGPAPVTTQDSEPVPDLAIAKGPRRLYFSRHPSPSETHLLIEVAVSSLSRDKNVKRRIYARAACPHYWVIDLVARQIHVYTDPRPDGSYGDDRIVAADVAVSVPVEGVGEFRLVDLLPDESPAASGA